MAKRQQLPELTQAQREIMEIVWEHGEVSASEVRQILSRQREVARNTVRTLLLRMEEKGWVKHREHGRTYVYSAVHPRNASIGQKVVEVVEDICGGKPDALFTALLDYRGLSDPEMQRIQRLLDQAKEKKQTKQNRRK